MGLWRGAQGAASSGTIQRRRKTRLRTYRPGASDLLRVPFGESGRHHHHASPRMAGGNLTRSTESRRQGRRVFAEGGKPEAGGAPEPDVAHRPDAARSEVLQRIAKLLPGRKDGR